MNPSAVDPQEAVAAARRALAAEPSSRKRRVQLARLLEGQGHMDEAQRVLQDGVGRDRLRQIEHALDAMREGVGLGPASDVPDRQFLAAGICNVCTILHGGPSPLHTKVVDTRRPGASKEVRLAQLVRSRGTCLERLMPEVVDVRFLRSRHLALITTRFVPGSHPTRDCIERVLDAWVDLNMTCKPEQSLLGLTSRRPVVDALRVLNVFVRQKRAFHTGVLNWLDGSTMAGYTFWWMQQHLRRREASPKIVRLVEECKRAWFDRRASRSLHPSEHFGLSHGDFHRGNLLIESDSGRCVLFDFAQLSIGLPGNDLAHVLAREPFSSPYVQERVFGYLRDRVPEFVESTPLTSAFGLALLVEKVQRQRVARLDAAFDDDIGPLAAWLHSRLAGL